ncbi:hypothetical protein V8E54_001411 [Elaphomyces granulatus]
MSSGERYDWQRELFPEASNNSRSSQNGASSETARAVTASIANITDTCEQEVTKRRHLGGMSLCVAPLNAANEGAQLAQHLSNTLDCLMRLKLKTYHRLKSLACCGARRLVRTRIGNPPQDEKDHHELYKTGHETKLVVAVTAFSKTGREAEEQELCSEEKMRQQLQACTIIGGPPPSETVDEFLVRIHRKRCAESDWFDTRLSFSYAIDSLTKNLEDADLEYLRLLASSNGLVSTGVNVAN